MDLERSAPKRTITKLDAIRHLIHASIRMHFAEEDPFANHLLIQSTEKLIGDYGRQKGIGSFLDFDLMLRPERKREFYSIYRETYNCFKHADKDHDAHLPVYDPVVINELSLLMNVSSAQQIGLPFSQHMRMYLSYMLTCYDDIGRFVSLPVDGDLNIARSYFDEHTRGELLSLVREAFNNSAEAQAERRRDLADVFDVQNSRGA